jgi:hypothetical protein
MKDPLVTVAPGAKAVLPKLGVPTNLRMPLLGTVVMTTPAKP